VRLLTGEFISGIGDWLYLVALLVVVYQESSDPLLLGIVGAARIVPYVLLSVPAGIIVDRYDRRLVLLVTDVARGLIMVALAVIVASDGPLLAVVALAVLATCFSCFFSPAIGAYLPTMVRDERELGPANSLFATLNELSFIIGPALAGIIIAAADLTLAFALNAVTFAVVAVSLATLPSSNPRKEKAEAAAALEAATAEAQAAADAAADAAIAAPTAGAGPTDTHVIAAAGATEAPVATAQAVAPDDPGATAQLMAIRRPLFGMLFLDSVAGFMFGGLSIITVMIAVDQLGVGEAGTGYLNAAVGIGGVLGAIGSGAIVARPNLAPAWFAGVLGLVLGFVLLGFSTALAPALLAMGIIAAGSLVADIVSTTIFQRIVPDELRGRVLGGMQMLSTGTYAAGSLVMPIAFAALGPQVILPLGAVIMFGAALVSLSILRPYFRREPDAATDILVRVSRLPILTGVPGPAIEAAAQRLVPVPVKAGDVVIRQGDPADRFYVIESGQFSVDQTDAGGATRRLRVMRPDEVFGELGLMYETPRTATVTAETDGQLLALDGPEFLELVSAASGLSNRFSERYRGAGTVAS
jgi:MFS family permease